ncbi:aspartate aminotransferase [Bradyrhizobium sp. CCBAU 11434]|uniref:aminotransferase class I/II-fold pyridoxal phosphate-dependent enzyme n=1 Tax=Bradyrhizobium sp. CCBAU 11434 TaxID=1630885 RepID=UPI002305A516|nr:aminotransferase class I/II-fold pyridoxal phosphate-dependent enzyme [Bradyrhizobium sp. CCBAU 11434]MDA9521336.1 aspartate aminotransferase [Bradyrhizobium sp. CCBAU 11434]
MLAQRTALFKLSGTAAATAAAKAAAARGEDIIDLTSGEIWCGLAPSVRDGAIAAINRDANRYTDTIGLVELRDALARKISSETALPWSADEIAVTSGAKQALFNASMALLNPGDEVLIPSPYWTTFPAQVVLSGARPLFIETRHNKYVPLLSDIEAAITPKSKAIVINTPNNPTGAVYGHDTLLGIATIAIDRKLWIIFDECYGPFVHAPHIHYPIVSVLPQVRDRTLIVNSFSKSLALPGWRIGYLAGPKMVIDAVRSLQSHTTSNPNVIAQHALLNHLQSGDSGFQSKLKRHITSGRTLGLSLLSKLQLVPPPLAEGGFCFYLDLSAFQRRASIDGHEFSADEVANSLLLDAGVATVSGTAFGDAVGMRLFYGIDLALLDKALRRVTETLNAWK